MFAVHLEVGKGLWRVDKDSEWDNGAPVIDYRHGRGHQGAAPGGNYLPNWGKGGTYGIEVLLVGLFGILLVGKG